MNKTVITAKHRTFSYVKLLTNGAISVCLLLSLIEDEHAKSFSFASLEC
jgi:hypothetical protein